MSKTMIRKQEAKENVFLMVLRNRYFHFIFFVLIFAFGLSANFSRGFYLLGGDGDYHLKYNALLRYGFSWNNDGLGLPVYGAGGVFPIVFILSFLEKFIPSVALVKFVLYLSIYLATFFSAYLTAQTLKLKPLTSFLLALFYVVNPFSLIYFTSLNSALTMVPVTMMFFFWVILRFYYDNRRLFGYFGLISLLLAFTSLNPPLSVIIQLSLLISINIVSYYSEGKYILKKVIVKYLLLIASFFLFNLWWMVNWFSFLSSGLNSQIYTRAFALDFLALVIHSSGIIIPRILTFTTYVPQDSSLNFFAHYYNGFALKFIALIPIALVVYFLTHRKNRTGPRGLLPAIFLVALGILFFAKGSAQPFGLIYSLLFRYFPAFYIFKGPVEKFGLLFVFTFTILLLFLVKGLMQTKKLKVFLAIFSFYLVFCLVPVLTGNLFPDSLLENTEGYMQGQNYESRVYKEDKNYEEARKKIDKEISDYRILGLPGSRDYYAVTFRSFGNHFYSGIDPLLSNTSKPFIVYGEKTSPLYRDFSSEAYFKLLALFNVGKILVNEYLVPQYGFPGGMGAEIIEKAIDKSSISTYNEPEAFH